MEGGKRKEDHLTAVWFAAGTAASLACIERAVVVSVERRVWVFLVLNLLLLAILFTSRSELQCSDVVDDQNGITNKQYNQKKRRHQCQSHDNRHVKIAESDGMREAQYQLTKEELNQRVEAFIAMFRQHLVSDAKENTWGPQRVSVECLE